MGKEYTLSTEMDEVEQIIRGSREIDRMKKDVEHFLSMVFGLAKIVAGRKFLDKNNVCFEIPSEDCLWVVFFDSGRGFNAECWVFNGLIKALAYKSENDCWVTYRVARVYNGLPVFLRGMVKHFPDIFDGLTPFHQAGLKKPRSE